MAEHAASLQAFYLVPTPLPCHINPAFLIFPFFLSINPLDFLFCLVQRSKPNTVDALTSRPQSRPSIHTHFPLKTIPIASWITSPCGIVAGDAHSLLSLFLTHNYFVAYLFLSQHCRRINTIARPQIIEAISGPLSISLACDFSFSIFSFRPISFHTASPLSTNDIVRESVRFISLVCTSPL